ncbi:hypothetical protein CAPTEDRAFT_187208 [Capitella teleta]|uniref:Uncharacterized protein n=1 Tax=Capitella teleta TaxID=283909 RepID=R7V8R9_CAPTE|nr:hypothetical protein CAPTEDRAFT_187208 [Capitella teleta]|eukprot:ELU15223.1 hypothetical protein CAPTEDRAFT_187208 [Capitella teleta]
MQRDLPGHHPALTTWQSLPESGLNRLTICKLRLIQSPLAVNLCHNDISMLKAEITDLKQKLDSASVAGPSPSQQELHDPSPACNRTNASSSFADIVRNTQRATMQDEDRKSELMISKINEKNNEMEFINKMQIDSKPKELKRIGKKLTGRNRLFKVPSPFRLMHEHLGQMRHVRNKEEQLQFAKAAKITRKLNNKAKEANASHFFIVRDNGEICKFAKSDDDKWKHDKEWVAPTHTELTESTSGNED